MTKERAKRIEDMIIDCVFGDGEWEDRFYFWGITEEEFDEFTECVFRYIDLTK